MKTTSEKYLTFWAASRLEQARMVKAMLDTKDYEGLYDVGIAHLGGDTEYQTLHYDLNAAYRIASPRNIESLEIEAAEKAEAAARRVVFMEKIEPFMGAMKPVPATHEMFRVEWIPVLSIRVNQFYVGWHNEVACARIFGEWDLYYCADPERSGLVSTES